MTTVRTIWGPAAEGGVGPYANYMTTYQLDDSNDAAAGIICLPRDGTITHVGFYVNAINGTPPSYNVGLTTVDSTGNPTQTAYGGSTNTTASSLSTGWNWVALAGNATANAGDHAVVHVWPTASVPDGSNNINVVTSGFSTGGYTALYTTVWARSPGTGLFAVKYNDNSIAGHAMSSYLIGYDATSATTPDEVGCVFVPPANITAYGIRTISYTFGSAAAYDFIIYDADNNALATCSITDKDWLDENRNISVFFDAVNLTAGSTYRVIVKPTVGTNGTFTYQRYSFESAAAMAAWPHGDGSWKFTSRTDAGAWTDVSTDLMYIGLHISDITFTTTTSGGGEFAYIG